MTWKMVNMKNGVTVECNYLIDLLNDIKNHFDFNLLHPVKVYYKDNLISTMLVYELLSFRMDRYNE